MTATRRLAAILAADVAGYSRLMGADEEGTHERLKAHRRELVDPKIREHSGRIVKTTGDGLLAEFPSVVDAVRCAAELQRGVIDREPEVPEDRRIRFRIGINLGDIIAEGGPAPPPQCPTPGARNSRANSCVRRIASFRAAASCRPSGIWLAINRS
jgi:adenylate cyclase